MSRKGTTTFRIVVQVFPSLQTGGRSYYSLIAYNGQSGEARVPVQYQSLEDLVKTLRRAEISLAEKSLVVRESNEPSIVFADTLELSEEQLSILGLKAMQYKGNQL